MITFISNAESSLNTSTQNSTVSLVLTLLLFGVIFYLMIFRPQQKRTKEHKKMMDSISKYDEVLTNGGLVGRVTKILENDYIIISLNEMTEVIIKRNFITAILPKGTIKAL